MADIAVLSGSKAKELLDLARDQRGRRPTDRLPRGTDVGGDGSTVQYVKISSTSKVGPYYPGHWYSYDAVEKTTSQEATAWIRDPNAGTLETDTYYPAVLQGIERVESVNAYTTSLGAAFTRTGDTITMDAVGTVGPFDGQAMAEGSLILFNPGTTNTGTWVMTVKGDASTAGEFELEEDGGPFVKVLTGSTYANTLWTFDGTNTYGQVTSPPAYPVRAVWAVMGTATGIESGVRPSVLADWYATALYYDLAGTPTALPYTRTGDVITPSLDEDVFLTEINGVLTVGERVLLDFGNSDSGVYVYAANPTPPYSPYILRRVSDFTSGVASRTEVEIADGLTWAESRWLLITDDPIVINTTSLTFELNGLPGYATVWRDKHNIKLWESLGYGTDVQYVKFFKGLQLGTAEVVTFSTNTSQVVGAKTLIWLRPQITGLEFQPIGTQGNQRLTIYNQGPEDCIVHCTNYAATGSPSTTMNLKFGQAIDLIAQGVGVSGTPIGSGIAWFLVDSADHVTGSPSVAQVLTLASAMGW